MEFRILGPLEVVSEGDSVTIRGAKPRALLALFLVHANRVVARDRLIDDLWEGSPPESAVATLQTYVSQLRSSLGLESLHTRTRGYVLEVEAFELDALRFERVLDATPRARDLAPDSTAARLAEALSWWRGPALADFVGALWADTEAARLEELRLDALERWAAARLALGEHAALVPALESLIAEHPLRERLWAHLMLALYRSDRQADALRAYGRLRQHLVDELGIEPSTDLAALETAILRHEPEIEWVPERGRPAVVSPLPSGAVTFLFTDIVGSTRLWEEQPDEMRAAVADQDQIARAAVAAHDGVVVKSTGDGLMVVFDDAPSAASAAVDAQLAVTRGDGGVPVALRMGLHTGSARPDNGDYQGPAVNRAARVAAQAYAGQILVSGATAALLEEWSLRDVGEHRLAGLPPMRLFQVVTPELPIDFPPLTTAVTRVDLPSSPTTFVGRGDEVDTIRRHVEQHRLVTMTGVGGCGKTRLAIESAASLEARFPDGVRFADLAAVTDSDRVNDAVIAALGLASDGTGRDPAERIAAYLADRAVLCVLDNCEHVVDACAELANAVINRSGSSRLLATSREPLGVIGEQIYVVPSLAFETEAVQLFADRAAEARAEFTVGETNRSTVAEICRRLDGMPLAIELAAATIAHLSPVQVLERLDDRFRLLTGGRGRRQRHQTLAATLDWSHDLLSPTERLVLRRLAAFPATFSLEAAQHVVDIGDLTDTLGSLVAKSLVQVVDAGERLRYRLLESVRLYTEAKLAAADERTASRTRHRDWVLDWLESIPLEERWFGDDDCAAAEQPNILAALDWSSAREDAPAVARIAAGFDWSRGETWREARRQCEAVLAGDDLSPELRLQVRVMLWWLGPVDYGGAQYDVDPVGAAEGMAKLGADAVAAAEGIESPLSALARSGHGAYATVPAIVTRDESRLRRAIEWADAGAAMSEQHSVPWRMYCLLNAGMAHVVVRVARIVGMTTPVDGTRADDLFAEGVDLAPPVAPYRYLRSALAGYLAISKLVNGNTARALDLARDADESTPAPRAGAPLLWWSNARGIALVVTLGEVGDHVAARRALREQHEHRHTDYIFGPESTLLLGGVLAAQRGDWIDAARLLGAGAQAGRRTPAEGLLSITYLERVRTALGAERAQQLGDEGRAMTLDDAIDLALR